MDVREVMVSLSLGVGNIVAVRGGDVVFSSGTTPGEVASLSGEPFDVRWGAIISLSVRIGEVFDVKGTDAVSLSGITLGISIEAAPL